jgi:hypothetical protein
MFNEVELREKVSEVFFAADENPHKYIRIVWTPNTQVAVIKGEEHPLTQVLFVYANQDSPIPTVMKSDEGYFHLLCKPKKHMAWQMGRHKEPISIHYLDLKGDRDKKSTDTLVEESEGPPKTDMLICVALTKDRSTIVIAFVNGTYILRTLDEGNSETLHGVIQTLVDICSLNRKEGEQHEQEEQK